VRVSAVRHVALTLAALAFPLTAQIPQSTAEQRVITFNDVETQSGKGLLLPESQSFVEDGMWVEAFWALHTGRPEGTFIRGHFHPQDLSTGFEGQHFGDRKELHGLYIKSVDGRPFWLKSLRYRVTRNRELPDHHKSIEGFNLFSVNVLIGTSFFPKASIRSLFSMFPVGQPVGNDLDLPFYTLYVTGFEFVSEVFIASTASVDLDDIVVEMH
jgi:hypothetical protein